MIKYVVCLLFNDDLSQVCLIEKNRPDWQADLLNGPGGKVEHGETIASAATREFEEETGVTYEDWRPLCFKKALDNSYQVYFLVAKNSFLLSQVRTKTDEQVSVRDVKHIDPTKLVSSLEWALPLAIYALAGKMEEELVHVNY